MLDLDNLTLIVHISEVAVTILATIYFYKYKNTNLKYFLPLLYLMVIHEFTIGLLYPILWAHYLVSNLFTALTTCFFMWLFRSYILDPVRRKIIKIFLLTYGLSLLASIFFQGFLKGGYDIAHLIGAILTVLSIMYFAIDLFSRKGLYKLSKNLLIWVGSGYLVYFISFPVIQAAKYYIAINDGDVFNIQVILAAIIVLMYSIISFGLIYSEKN